MKWISNNAATILLVIILCTAIAWADWTRKTDGTNQTYYTPEDNYNYINITTIRAQNIVVENINITNEQEYQQPTAMLINNATVYISATTTAEDINYTETIIADEISIINNTVINITESGKYLIATSIIADCSVAAKHIEVWANKNGQNIPNSNTKLEIPQNSETILAVTFIEQLNKNDLYKLQWNTDNTGCKLLATTAGTNPTRPLTPSIITSITHIST